VLYLSWVSHLPWVFHLLWVSYQLKGRATLAVRIHEPVNVGSFSSFFASGCWIRLLKFATRMQPRTGAGTVGMGAGGLPSGKDPLGFAGTPDAEAQYTGLAIPCSESPRARSFSCHVQPFPPLPSQSTRVNGLFARKRMTRSNVVSTCSFFYRVP
jgi:hypothetical protein